MRKRKVRSTNGIMNLSLRRPTTSEEIERDPDRWHGYDPGDFTSSFDTKEEIIALAKECFKMRFKGEWEPMG